MTRAGKISGICQSFLTSFSSRCNDLSGYWAIGLFHAFMLKNDTPCFEVDLLNINAKQNKVFPIQIIQYYQNKFYRLTKIEKLDLEKLDQIRLNVYLHSDKTRPSPVREHPMETLITCKLSVIDTEGIVYAYAMRCWSFPHRPELVQRRMESKRGPACFMC